jgi:hypothetical protein
MGSLMKFRRECRYFLFNFLSSVTLEQWRFARTLGKYLRWLATTHNVDEANKFAFRALIAQRAMMMEKRNPPIGPRILSANSYKEVSP